MASSYNMVKTGVVKGNAATKKVVLGFKPRHVELFNSTNFCSAMKSDSMSGSSAKKQVAAGTATFPANMVTLNDDGFTIGNDAVLNAAASDIHYVASEGKNE